MGTWRDGRGKLTVGRRGEPGGSEDRVGLGGAAGSEGSGAVAGVTVDLEIAASYGARRRGLLARDGIEGALLITPCGSVHTFRMRFAIDVAYLDKELRVVDVHTLRPGRLPLPRWRARHVLEAEAGAMARWGLRKGTRVSVDAPGPNGQHQRASPQPR